MDTPLKALGAAMRQLFVTVARRPMSWNMVDAFAKLEEREEEMREREQDKSGSAKPDTPKDGA
jgi:hypothetical protein